MERAFSVENIHFTRAREVVRSFPSCELGLATKGAEICEVYKAAVGADAGHRTVSIDEMTGIQALGRAAPGLPMMPGKIERREFECVPPRHSDPNRGFRRQYRQGQRGDRLYPD